MFVRALAGLLALLGCLSATSVAAEEDRRFYGGAGVLFFNTGQFANQASGATSIGGQVLPELSLMARFPIGSSRDWLVSPLLSFAPLGSKTPDGGITTRVLRLEGRAVRKFGSVFDAKLGIGMANMFVSGSGETIQLNNGTGMSTFGFPSDTSTSTLFYWVGGVGVEPIKPVTIEAAVFMMGPLSSSRSLSYSLLVSFGFL